MDHAQRTAEVVVLADDLVRARQMLNQLKQTVYSGASTHIAPLKEGFHGSAKNLPRLIILDIQDTTVVDPLMHIKHIKQIAPDLTIVIITRDSNPELAQRALRAGATAYLTDEEADTMLADALEFVASGEHFVSEAVMQGILHGIVKAGYSEDRVPIEVLSDREMVIFQMIGHGKPFREIAEELNVNVKTIATHCNNIRRKVRSRDNRHLTRLCRNWVTEAQTHHT